MALPTFTSGQFAGAAEDVNLLADEIERVVAGNFGNFTNLARPTFLVRRTSPLLDVRSDAQNPGETYWADITIPFQTRDSDPDGMWDPGEPDRVTIRTPGIWLVLSQVRWEAREGGSRATKILLNGANPDVNAIASGKEPGTGPVPGEGNTIQLSAFRRFVAGDGLLLNEWQSSSGPIDLEVNFGGIHLSGVWLGP